MIIKLSDFTTRPGPKLRAQGDFSGEEWREEHLIPAILNAKRYEARLLIDLDGVDGFASSFLEGAFEGIVPTHLKPEDVGARINIRCIDEPDIVSRIFATFRKDMAVEAVTSAKRSMTFASIAVIFGLIVLVCQLLSIALRHGWL